MVLNTRITREYGIKYPIISAGMAFIAQPSLAAAVSNAGGMGMLGCGMVPPEGLRQLIQQTREQTPHPFGVDLITDFVNDDHIEICLQENVPVVVFFWSLPTPAWVSRLQDLGSKVWMEVGSLVEADQAKQLGVDAIVAQGQESGGHNRAEASTFSVVPAICRKVNPIPVIAAGGIVDGKSLVAALALGAEAGWCGSRFLASVEAHAHPEYKERVLRSSVEDTVRTTLFGPEWPGHLMRVIRNRVINQWQGREAEVDPSQYADEIIGTTLLAGQTIPLPKFSVLLPTPATTGDFEEMAMTAGESIGNIHDLQPAGVIVENMVAEAVQIIHGRLLSFTSIPKSSVITRS
jgi:NAD(P)H-dependent flavin oxidoreductase YrpB (nitropropane dioxygenase family)